MVCRDGSVRWFQCRGTARFERTRHAPARMVGTFWDITDRKGAEAALRTSELALRATNAEIQDLAGRLIAAQEAERARIARDLHDDMGQKLALLTIDIDQLGRRRLARRRQRRPRQADFGSRGGNRQRHAPAVVSAAPDQARSARPGAVDSERLP